MGEGRASVSQLDPLVARDQNSDIRKWDSTFLQQPGEMDFPAALAE